jgi:hypothetical protein
MRNGYLSTTFLAPIGGGKYLARDVAPYFLRMLDDMEADGLGRPTVNWEEHGLGAAYPGFSNHGLGLSVDLNLTARQLAWLRKYAHRYGFKEDVANESWHWTFKLTPTIDLEDDMFTPEDRKLLEQIRDDLGKTKTAAGNIDSRTVSIQKLLGTVATRLAAVAAKMGLK